MTCYLFINNLLITKFSIFYIACKVFPSNSINNVKARFTPPPVCKLLLIIIVYFTLLRILQVKQTLRYYLYG